MTDADLARVHANTAADADAALLYYRLLRHADLLVASPAAGGQNGIDDVVYSLGLAHRLTGNATYATAAIAALRALVRNPDICHGCEGDCTKLEADGGQSAAVARTASLCFGNTGHSLAIGYDWLYGAMSDDDRAAIRRAISAKPSA